MSLAHLLAIVLAATAVSLGVTPLVLDVAYPLTGGLAVFVTMVFVNYVREEAQRRQIRNANLIFQYARCDHDQGDVFGCCVFITDCDWRIIDRGNRQCNHHRIRIKLPVIGVISENIRSVEV